MPEQSPLTRAIRAGLETDTTHGAVVPPIYLSTNYSFFAPGEPREYDYGRAGNPTRDQFGQALAGLEGGAGASIVTSGLAAITLCVAALLPVGARVVAPHDCYGGTWRLFSRLAQQGRVEVDFVDIRDQAALTHALDGAALLWLETPSNPLLRITDIAATTALAKTHSVVTVADNTFCSPLRQRPIELGVDAVVHSTTKFINGHSDVVGGAVIAASAQLHETFNDWANVLGLTGSAFDSFLSVRGLRTLDARLRVHESNAAAIVAELVNHPAVAAVHYPGLHSHPDYEIATRQQSGYGSIISFELEQGFAGVERFLDGLEIFSLAESLGGIESLICHPRTMTHATMTEDALETAGISFGLLRLSVGIEHVDDLVTQVRQALNRAG